MITLTFTPSKEEITSGVPQSVEIIPSDVATIYYTIDGSTPTLGSLIYIEAIAFPTNTNSVVLSAFGVDNVNVAGPILTITYAADETRIDRARLIGQEGLTLDAYGVNPQYTVGYDANGNPATYLNFEPELVDMEKIHGAKGFDGVAEGTLVRVNIPDPSTEESTRYDDMWVPFSTTESAKFFDPNAQVIFIDNRKDNEVKSPVLRTYGSMDNIYNEFQGVRIRNSEDIYISGGFSKRFFDQRTQTMISYYWDHNTCRWVRNIQQLPVGAPAMPQNGIGIANDAKQPLVFKWLLYGRQSGIV